MRGEKRKEFVLLIQIGKKKSLKLSIYKLKLKKVKMNYS